MKKLLLFLFFLILTVPAICDDTLRVDTTFNPTWTKQHKFADTLWSAGYFRYTPGATVNYVLTCTTATGFAAWKVAPGGGGDNIWADTTGAGDRFNWGSPTNTPFLIKGRGTLLTRKGTDDSLRILIDTTTAWSPTWLGTHTFGANVNPSVTGKGLGTTGSRWDAYIRNLDVNGTFTGNVVDSANIIDGAVKSAEIFNNTIDTQDVKTAAIDSEEVATGAIKSLEIFNNTIDSNDIKNDAVTSFEILDLTILAGDIANDAVNGAKISLTGEVTGDITYYSAPNWVRLAIGTANQVLHGGASAPAWSAVDLASADVTGTLVATKGGTGQATVTTGDLLYGSATNTWSKLAKGSANQRLAMDSAGTNVQWMQDTVTVIMIPDSTSNVKAPASRHIIIGQRMNIVAVKAIFQTAITLGDSIMFDLNKNGTTMYTTQGTPSTDKRPKLKNADAINTIKTFTLPDVVTLTSSDYLTLDVDVVQGTSPKNIAVSFAILAVRIR